MNDVKTGESEERSENILTTVPLLRDKVLRVRTLGTGAKLLFTKLTDLVFLRKLSLAVGVVKIGMPRLAEMLACSECTIDRYAEELEHDGRIWRKVIYEARSKMTAWYIRELAEPQLEFFDRANQSYGPARVKQPAPVRDVNGKFVKPGSSPQICFDGKIRANEAAAAELRVSSPQNCRDHPRRIAEMIPAELTVLTPQNSGDHPRRTAGIIPADLTGQSPQICPDHNGKTAGMVSAEVRDKEDIHTVNSRNTGYSFKRSTGLSASRKGIPTEKFEMENSFMKDVAEVMDAWKPGHSKNELTGSGAWWRLGYRINRDLAEKVLAEIKVMVKERKIKFNPGSTAVDLWTRWQGGKVSNEIAEAALLKQNAATKAAART
jgi:hypothetical protein